MEIGHKNENVIDILKKIDENASIISQKSKNEKENEKNNGKIN